jgi:rod shape-determining protein MreC
MRDYLNDQPIKLRRSATSAARSRRPVLLGLALMMVAGLLIVLDYYGWLQPARSTADALLAPVTLQVNAMRRNITDLLSGPTSISALNTENAALKQEISQLQAELIRLEQARIENQRLRRQLAIEQSNPWKLRGAEVLVRSPDGNRRTMTIASGTEEGVNVGMAVIGQTGSSPAALVGTVEAVGPHTARVLLITDVAHQISARVLHADDAALGLVQGQWQQGSRLRALQLERDIQIAAGDRVVSAGLSAVLDIQLDVATIPPGIPIGVVESINTDNNARSAELRPFVDPDQVRYVWIVIADV